MDVTANSNEKNATVTLAIQISGEELDPYIEEAVKAISKDRPLKGFRPGKVPVSVGVQQFGAEVVLQAALERAVPHFFVQAVAQEQVEAIGRPQTAVKKADLKEGATIEATVDVLPTVSLGDVSQISVERRGGGVSDEDVERELKALAKSRSSYIDVMRPAQKEDTVFVDFKVLKDGEPLPGGESKNHPVHLGEGHFVPGFEEKLIGIQGGESREFEMTFPDDYAEESLRGITVKAFVTAKEVKKRVSPELNDEFATSLGDFSSLADLKVKIRENLQQELKQKEEERVRGEITEKLADQAEFSALPDSLVEREIDRRLQEFAQMLAMRQKSIEEYLKESGRTLEQIRTDFREAAEKTVRVSLALRTFAQEVQIEVTDEQVQEAMEEFLTQYAPKPEDREKIDQEELLLNVTSHLRNKAAIEELEKRVQLTEASEPAGP